VLIETDANGHTTTYTYDPLNRRLTKTDALSEETQYFYDTGTFTGPVNGITCVECGATPGSSFITEQIDPDGAAGVHAGVTYYMYDALDRLVIKDRKTGCIGAGCPDTITPTDAVTTYTYDPVGNRLTSTEPDGNTTTYNYDADNRRIQVTDAAGDVIITTYDGVGNVITLISPNLNVTTDTYNSLNRLINVSDSDGQVAAYAYDPVGNRVTSADGNGNTTTYGYDALNRLITQTDPLGKTTTSQYDSVGNLLTVTDRNGNTTTYTYDAINRRITMTDALGNVTKWQYDPVGNMIVTTDANSHATQYAYDAVNRPVKQTYADGLSVTYTYDKADNILTRTDQIGQTTTYTYNDLYFLVSRAYPVSGTDTMTYDLSGRLLSAQHGGWPVTFAYDGADRVIQTTQNGKTVGYVFNIPGRTRQITYPGGRTITEHTDFRMRTDHINDAAYPQTIVQYTYDLADNVLSRDYRNGTTSSFTYNANNWTTDITHNNPATFAQFGYAYDNEGNKQYENKTPQSPTQSEGYQYDSTYRLINYEVGTLVGSTIPVPSTQTSYSLDPVGNWNSKTTNSITQTRQYNADNELIEINAQGLTYDNDGNTLNDGTYTYAHDEENRLISVTRNSDSAVVGQYQYDALFRRVQSITDPAGTASTTVYYHDGPRLIEDQNSLGVTSATYVYGNYVDEILTMDVGGNTYYYHQNALWSVEAVTDSTATPVERYAYDAYGFVTVTSGTGTPVPQNAWGTPHSAIGNPWMFTGRQLDEETGLYYYRNRYYDPAKGRFLQRDPDGYVDGLNLYQYVGRNPINSTDPMGLDESRCGELKFRGSIEPNPILDRLLKFVGFNNISAEVYGGGEWCPLCCGNGTSSKKVTGKTGAKIEGKAGKKELDLKFLNLSIGPYIRVAADYNVSFSYDGCANKFTGGGCGKLEAGIGLEGEAKLVIPGRWGDTSIGAGANGEGSVSAEICIKNTVGSTIGVTAQFCGTLSFRAWANASFWGATVEFGTEAKQTACSREYNIYEYKF
jgi:RHS repeat-associated protein